MEHEGADGWLVSRPVRPLSDAFVIVQNGHEAPVPFLFQKNGGYDLVADVVGVPSTVHNRHEVVSTSHLCHALRLMIPPAGRWRALRAIYGTTSLKQEVHDG